MTLININLLTIIICLFLLICIIRESIIIQIIHYRSSTWSSLTSIRIWIKLINPISIILINTITIRINWLHIRNKTLPNTSFINSFHRIKTSKIILRSKYFYLMCMRSPNSKLHTTILDMRTKKFVSL